MEQDTVYNETDIDKAKKWIAANLKEGESKDVGKSIFNRLRQLDKYLFIDGVILTYFNDVQKDYWGKKIGQDFSVKLIEVVTTKEISK